MSDRLTDKVAIITGTASGQGRAAAQVFAAAGARVVGCDRDAEGAAETVRLVTEAGGEMTSLHPVDVTDRAAAGDVVRLAVDTYGAVDILYNNAAYAFFAPFPEISYEEWSATLRGELDIVFHITQEAWPHLAASGRGAIVNIASIAGIKGFGLVDQASHSTGKGGVIALTKQLAAEGRHHGIRANSISPGFILTPILEPFLQDEAWATALIGGQLVKRPGRPEDVAYTALFLASEEAAFITGKDIEVDGGMLSWACPA